MGCKPAPSYANVFMARKIDVQVRKFLEKCQENRRIPMKYMKSFLDDIFLVFIGTIENLHRFIQDINMIHPNIKFTMSHTTPSLSDQKLPSCSCPQMSSCPYLDVSCEIKEGKIVTVLYKKPTDKKKHNIY